MILFYWIQWFYFFAFFYFLFLIFFSVKKVDTTCREDITYCHDNINDFFTLQMRQFTSVNIQIWGFLKYS